MAAAQEGIFHEDLRKKILDSKIFVVGAGGIGCELLKNLVLTGFQDIEVIDLDTIDVSNLNRQFLFHKQHVGKSKAAVATESALKFNPNAKIKHYHDSVISPEYNVKFFERFNVVLNALDNLAARKHVNRLCYAADVPLIESGTAGYLGQVEVFKKGVTRCYECEVKRLPKTFPSCTIRNTPSEPIHCIVWAKHLFNQLFGEADADEDVSPDAEDPELVGKAGEKALEKPAENGAVDRKSTRTWAQESSYDPAPLFQKLFHDDIEYLLTMKHLWEKRRPPTPLDMKNLPDAVAGSSKDDNSPGLKDMKVWSIVECFDVFKAAVKALKSDMEGLSDGGHLVWDKDDRYAMDFVAACSNIRAHIFGIQQKPRFEVKSMAGNIIPAIATTNAIVAGVVVLRAMKVLQDQVEQCPIVYLRNTPNHNGVLLVAEKAVLQRDAACIICGADPEVTLQCNVNKMTVKELEELVLKKELNMAAPDVILAKNFAVVLSSDDEEMNENNDKPLSAVGIEDGSELKVDDFLQNYNLTIRVKHYECGRDEPEFVVHFNSKDIVPPKPEQAKEVPSSSTSENPTQVEEEDDLVVVEEGEDVVVVPTPLKRRIADDEPSSSPPKKRLRDVQITNDEEECMVLD